MRFVPSWFPGASFKKFGEQGRKQLSDADTFPHLWAKEQIVRVAELCHFAVDVLRNRDPQASGKYDESFTSQHLLPDDEHIVDEEEESVIKWCTSAMFFAGTDTVCRILPQGATAC